MRETRNPYSQVQLAPAFKIPPHLPVVKEGSSPGWSSMLRQCYHLDFDCVAPTSRFLQSSHPSEIPE